MRKLAGLLAVIVLALMPVAVAEDWTYWRGPYSQGVSDETDLITDWSPEGENLLWKVEHVGRSTPIVIDGRVCNNGRVGDGVEKQEVVRCWDVETGELLWDRRFNVYNTTVPFNRVGWASLVADPETGYIYAHGVAGGLVAYDADGKIVWSRFLTEEVGHLHGYGGRTQTPLVDGPQLIISFVSSGWGNQAAPKNRYWSFDKKTGELNWVSTPGGFMKDANTQGCPVVADIGGERLLISGDADGHIYAMKASTGEKVWGFLLSKRAINSTVLVAGDTVFASHSEENIDDPTMGRFVAIDGTGKGDVTATHEKWRINELSDGFPSSAYKDGKLWVIDNSANLFQIDAATGTIEWEHSVGTVGKASPVWADGKLYITETNGRIHILKPGADSVEVLSSHEVTIPDGERYAEIYGSPAISDGRVFISSEGYLYALGDKSRKGGGRSSGARFATDLPAAPKNSETTWVQVRPVDVLVHPGEKVSFEAWTFDAMGRTHGKTKKVEGWALSGLTGKVSKKGVVTFDGDKPQAGTVTATIGGVTGTARVRVVPELDWDITFDDLEVGSVPPTWIGARVKYAVQEKDGEKVLAKLHRERGLLRNPTYMGPSTMSNYTVEADLMGNNRKRRKADLGVINGGYTIDLLGNHQRLQVRSWNSENRMMQQVDFAWEMGVWYRMKARVDTNDEKAVIRAKVWKKGESEPSAWTITVEDPLAIAGGSPGLIGYSPADIYYDNVKVTVNK